MARYCLKGQHLSVSDYPEIYPPSDDTFLLIDALEVGHNTVLELGTGSGIVAIYCANKGARVTRTDINPHAARLARQNAEENGVDITVVEADMFGGIRGRFEIMIFNPPYLPSPKGLRWHSTPVPASPEEASMQHDASRFPCPQDLLCSLTPSELPGPVGGSSEA